MLYEHVQTYLSAQGNKDTHRLLVSLPKGASKPMYTMADNASCEDKYKGASQITSAAISRLQYHDKLTTELRCSRLCVYMQGS